MLMNICGIILIWGFCFLCVGGLIGGGIYFIKEGIDDLNWKISHGLIQIILGSFAILCGITIICIIFKIQRESAIFFKVM